MKAAFFATPALILAVAVSQPVTAQDKKTAATFTVEQCINLYAGLNSLNFQGQQLNDPTKAPPGTKMYKLNVKALTTISLDIAALTSVVNSAQTEQNTFTSNLPALPKLDTGKTSSPERDDAINAQNKMASLNWQKILHEPCPVAPGRLDAQDLKLGDGTDDNQFPPSVIGAIVPIIDGLK